MIGQAVCAFHTPRIAKPAQSLGGKMSTARPVLEPVEIADASLSNLRDIPAAMETIYRKVATGGLDPKQGSTMVFAANAASQALKAIADIEERERKRNEELSDDDLEAAIDRALERYMAKRRQ